MPTIICVIAFIACLVFILVLFNLVKNTNIDGPVPKTFQEAVRAFREARNWRVRGFVIFICTPVFFGESYRVVLALIAVSSLVCLVAICGSATTSPLLGHVRDILDEVYRMFAPARQ
jgi:fucose permease